MISAAEQIIDNYIHMIKNERLEKTSGGVDQNRKSLVNEFHRARKDKKSNFNNLNQNEQENT